jgi:hypothetical protein
VSWPPQNDHSMPEDAGTCSQATAEATPHASQSRGPWRERDCGLAQVEQAVSIGRPLLSSAPAIPIRSDATAMRHTDAAATFYFDGQVDGVPYPTLSPAQQAAFKADFCREVTSLKQWALGENWLPAPCADLQIFVSDEYKISRSLVPAAVDRRGRMEFPAWKVVAGEAAILHELVHVFFPNGNRFLAEGLAIFLQATIGGNPAFPNFGRPLHEVARELVRESAPQFMPGKPESLDKLRLADLDRIATPSPLRLRVGRYLYDNTPAGQAYIYPMAGSFVQFLVEVYGTNKFRALFERTPLVPFGRDAGTPERWVEVYGIALSDLELQWRSMIMSSLA